MRCSHHSSSTELPHQLLTSQMPEQIQRNVFTIHLSGQQRQSLWNDLQVACIRSKMSRQRTNHSRSGSSRRIRDQSATTARTQEENLAQLVFNLLHDHKVKTITITALSRAALIKQKLLNSHTQINLTTH